MDLADFKAAIRRLREIAGEGRGRVSVRAAQALADVDRALNHFRAGHAPETLPRMSVNASRRLPRDWRERTRRNGLFPSSPKAPHAA